MTEAWRALGAATPLPPLLGQVKEVAFAELHRRLAEQGFDEIRPGHGCVFRFVDRGGSRLTDLSHSSGFTKQAVGEVADDLERLGYVERAPDPSDRRAKLIRLTDRGSEAQAAAMRIFGEIERGWERRYGKERIRLLRELLEEIVADERGEAAAA